MIGNLILQLHIAVPVYVWTNPVVVVIFVVFCQFLILVVDSTDRERLAVTKAELYNMLSHEVRHLFSWFVINILLKEN